MTPALNRPLGQPFEAQYWGTCGVCREGIKPGQMARYGPGTIGVIHNDCDHPDKHTE